MDLDISVLRLGVTPSELAVAGHGELLVGYIQVKNERVYLVAASSCDEADLVVSVCLHVVLVDSPRSLAQLEPLDERCHCFSLLSKKSPLNSTVKSAL